MSRLILLDDKRAGVSVFGIDIDLIMNMYYDLTENLHFVFPLDFDELQNGN